MHSRPISPLKAGVALLIACSLATAVLATDKNDEGVELFEVVPQYDPNIKASRAASKDPLDLEATPPELWAADLSRGEMQQRKLLKEVAEPDGLESLQDSWNEDDRHDDADDRETATAAADQEPGQAATPAGNEQPEATEVGAGSEAAEATTGGGAAEQPSTLLKQAAAEGVDAMAYAAAQPTGTTQQVLESLAAGGAAAGPGTADEEESGQRRRLMQQQLGAAGGVSQNKPGAFLGGPSLTKQHSGFVSDNPKFEDSAEQAGDSQQSGAGSGGLGRNIVRSLTNDMMFAVKFGNQGQPGGAGPKRRLQSADGASGAADSSDGLDPVALDPAKHFNEYTPQAFALLPEVAAKQQEEQLELERRVFGQIVSGARGAAAAARAAAAQVKAARDAEEGEAGKVDEDAKAAKRHRKLIDVSGAASRTAVISSAADAASYNGHPLHGVTYSWRRANGCDAAKRVCQCPEPWELEDDLELIHKYATRFRTYSVECPETMRMLLHYTTVNPEFSWMVGVWVGKDDAMVQRQITLLGKLLEAFPDASISAVAVGSEAVSRGDVSEDKLISYIKQARDVVRAAATASGSERLARGVPVTTAELPWAWSARLAAAVDVVAANIQPFYSGKVDANSKSWARVAVGSALQHYGALATRFRGKRVVVAEVGWPTASGPRDVNVGSPEGAARFAQEWVKTAKAQGVAYYYHELADSSWKTTLRAAPAPAAEEGAAAQGGEAAGGAPAAAQQPEAMGDEHFGLVSGDRQVDKGLLGAF